MSTFPVPRGPRATLQIRGNTAASSLSAVLEKVARSLHSRLALLGTLANFQDKPRERKSSGDDICEARRDFLCHFAYLCDVEKGGSTVTAAGLQQKSPTRIILWLAANEGVREDVKSYADIILNTLKAVEPKNQDVLQDEVFHIAVEKCHLRIDFYKARVRRYATRCRMQLNHEIKDDTGILLSRIDNNPLLIGEVQSLRSKLKKLSEPPHSMTAADIVDLCYSMRGPQIDELRCRSRNEEDDFRNLVHYIGRLSATRSAANAAVRAMMIVPALRHISCIRYADAPAPRAISGEQISPYELVREICQASTVQNPLHTQSALHSIVDLDFPTDSIRAGLESRNRVVTRVHAELQVANNFSRHKWKFVDDDKFVGCSKPACYFCYTWLSNRRHHTLPATHLKVVCGCRGPDSGPNEAGAAFVLDMYKKMCATLDQDIMDFLLRSGHEDRRSRGQYMSTEGSSRAPSQVPVAHPM